MPSPYDQQQEPSLAQQYFNPSAPFTSWRNLAAANVWARLPFMKITETGFESPGVLGLRSILTGTEGRTALSTYNPLRYLTETAVQMVKGTETASRFRTGGFFGVGGLVKESSIANIFGGRFANITRRRHALFSDDISEDFFNEYSKRGFPKSSPPKVPRSVVRDVTIARQSGFSDVIKNLTKIKGEGLSDVNAIKGTLVRRAAAKNLVLKSLRLAKGISGFLLAFDIGKLMATGIISGAANVAGRVEAKLAGTFNNRMEFGGNIPIGLMTSRSATERQRALSFIRTGGGRNTSGEAALMHQ